MLIVMETLLLLSLTIVAILSFLPSSRFSKWAFRGALITIALLILELAMGHARWQMIPAYSLAALLAGITYYRCKNIPVRSLSRKLLFGGYVLLGTVSLCLAVIAPKAFPMFEAPAPTGKYKVGSSSIYLKDETRPELHTDDPNDKRELMVRVWYPSDVPAETKPLPYMNDTGPLRATLASSLPAAGFVFDHLRQIPGHSYANTPLLSDEQKFRVLVFNHGMGVYATSNALALENLASHGYVVFSIDHTYNASWVEFPDGRVATFKANESTPTTDAEMTEFIKPYKNMVEGLYAENYDQYLAKITSFANGQPTLNAGLNEWVEDNRFLLDELALMDADRSPGIDFFSGRLDIDKVGVFGMSYGGATAGVFCAIDSRCAAGLNMDGFQFGEDALRIALEKPFMMMNSDSRLGFEQYFGAEFDWSKPLNFAMNDFIFYQSKDIAYSLNVGKATHMNFTDVGYASKIASWIGALGSINLGKMNDIMNDYSLAFFNHHLRDMQEPLLDGATDKHPDITKFVSRNGRGVEHDQARIENYPPTPKPDTQNADHR